MVHHRWLALAYSLPGVKVSDSEPQEDEEEETKEDAPFRDVCLLACAVADVDASAIVGEEDVIVLALGDHGCGCVWL